MIEFVQVTFQSFDDINVGQLKSYLIPLLSSKLIWSLEPFTLFPGLQDTDNLPKFYFQKMQLEDLQEEWFLVYLFINLTSKFDIGVRYACVFLTCVAINFRITDSDGEFLLIEAAKYIPKWINPENSEGRVFLYEGKIHIIPPIIPTISISKSTFSEKTEASQSAQDSIANKIKEYY